MQELNAGTAAPRPDLPNAAFFQRDEMWVLPVGNAVGPDTAASPVSLATLSSVFSLPQPLPLSFFFLFIFSESFFCVN